MDHIRNVVIMGSGCAGHTAALYTARANLKPLVLEGHEPDGQLSLTTLVENFPGFPEGIQGPELMEIMRKQAERFDTDFIDEDATAVDFRKRPFEVTAARETLRAESVIIATGAGTNWLGLPNEQRLIGHGI